MAGRHYRDYQYRRRNPGRGLGRGLVLVCFGCVLIAIGLSLGGHFSGFRFWPWSSHSFNFEWGTAESGDKKSIQPVAVQNAVIPAGIRNLDIKLNAASLIIRTGSSGSYQATDFDENALKVTGTGTSLRIEEGDWKQGFPFGRNHRKPVLEITLPNGTELSDCTLWVGAGTVSVEGVKSDRLSIESGAGSIQGKKLVARSAVLKTGAGSLELENCTFVDTDIETGAGRVVFSGDMTGASRVNTGAGAVEISLAGTEKQYRIDFNRGLGRVRIGTATYTGVGNGTAGEPTAERKITLSTGLGSVGINFSE
jgi:hypothetical protein